MRAPATIVLIVLNVIVFGWQYVSGDLSGRTDTMVYDGALVGVLVVHGEWWRIVTGAFEHASVLHIASNMFALFQVGSFVEIISGRSRMLALYFISMLGSGLAVTFFTPESVTVGASGAVFGLFGALVAIGIRLGKDGRSLIGQTLPIIAINLGLGFAIPNISQAAHVGGLISGFVSGLALFMMQRRSVVAVEQVEAQELAEHPDAALMGKRPDPTWGAARQHDAPATHDEAAKQHGEAGAEHDTVARNHDAAGDAREAAEEEPR